MINLFAVGSRGATQVPLPWRSRMARRDVLTLKFHLSGKLNPEVSTRGGRTKLAWPGQGNEQLPNGDESPTCGAGCQLAKTSSARNVQVEQVAPHWVEGRESKLLGPPFHQTSAESTGIIAQLFPHLRPMLEFFLSPLILKVHERNMERRGVA